MNMETTRPRGRPKNRWQDEVREDGRIVGGEEWQEKVYNREEWRKNSARADGMNEMHVNSDQFFAMAVVVRDVSLKHVHCMLHRMFNVS
jgi:hypothetical protein